MWVTFQMSTGHPHEGVRHAGGAEIQGTESDNLGRGCRGLELLGSTEMGGSRTGGWTSSSPKVTGVDPQEMAVWGPREESVFQ